MPSTAEMQEFSIEEVAISLIRQHNIKTGIWRFFVRFALAGVNVPHPEDPKKFTPASLVPIQRMGLMKAEKYEDDGLHFDAAKVWTSRAQAEKKSPEPPMEKPKRANSRRSGTPRR